MGKPKGGKQAIELTEKRREALKLRKAGATYDHIAATLGYKNRGAAYKCVMSALKVLLREPGEELRRLESERLDALLLAIWPEAEKGNLLAVDRVLRIMDRRARLLGLDAPAKLQAEAKGQIDHHHEHTIGMEEIEQPSDERAAEILQILWDCDAFQPLLAEKLAAMTTEELAKNLPDDLDDPRVEEAVK